MMFSFQPEAELEFQQAVDFYENCEPGLGEAFYEEVQSTIRRILRFPTLWPQYTGRSRRCLCNRFPYSIVYRFTDGEIAIYAVMHQKRRPGYWRDRVS
jgi:plasmid stabilization system protein ParE